MIISFKVSFSCFFSFPAYLFISIIIIHEQEWNESAPLFLLFSFPFAISKKRNPFVYLFWNESTVIIVKFWSLLILEASRIWTEKRRIYAFLISGEIDISFGLKTFSFLLSFHAVLNEMWYYMSGSSKRWFCWCCMTFFSCILLLTFPPSPVSPEAHNGPRESSITRGNDVCCSIGGGRKKRPYNRDDDEDVW